VDQHKIGGWSNQKVRFTDEVTSQEKNLGSGIKKTRSKWIRGRTGEKRGHKKKERSSPEKKGESKNPEGCELGNHVKQVVGGGSLFLMLRSNNVGKAKKKKGKTRTESNKGQITAKQKLYKRKLVPVGGGSEPGAFIKKSKPVVQTLLGNGQLENSNYINGKRGRGCRKSSRVRKRTSKDQNKKRTR